ncbi:GTPase domain-containing protein [Polyangium aurulentum]|uniref:GTPase domain-containing protein n=1 Tax=Polyangium aurulentum TaxID=2567896 RepID=UPI0010AEAC6A|nr:GTPase domain-containing protein [Polyangium aurulentum]UQA61203.1 GTPase domain-containing protein [Polyangium aurulentum]
MSLLVIIVIAAVAASLAIVLVLVGMRSSRLAEELGAAKRRLESLQAEHRALAAKLATTHEEDRKKIGWLDHQEQEINWLRDELEKRPKIVRKTYKILTLGVKATGKTSLTLKWANPLIDLGSLEGTKIERYERTVSQAVHKDTMTEHVFEVHDWGGEHIVDAQQELIVEEIHGLLVVVDLGGKDAKQAEPARIQEQLQEFQAQALKYFFGPKTVASCKTVVLFINKSDLLPGTPAQVEEQAKQLYAPLIENLNRYSTHIDVRVFVGSASYGHSTHMLFSHFVERILPKHAYDAQLLQRMKSDFATTRVPASRPGLPAVSSTHHAVRSNGAARTTAPLRAPEDVRGGA